MNVVVYISHEGADEKSTRPTGPGTDHIGPIANELLADVTSNSSRNEGTLSAYLLGPSSTYEAFYISLLSRILDLIVNGELYSPWAVDAFLIHRFLLDLIPSPIVSSHDKQGHIYFCLRYENEKGNHIIVDEDYNITGIVVWEWTYTNPSEEVFSSPMGLWDISTFFEGVDGLSDKEREFSEFVDM
ncbi:hypothetical protein BDD12DRAFT_890896 [Trichophaea hybrida]|nr:hypothetical protein BDD12DRAFT_890896 [Trichophaea hybrida]